MGLGLRCRSTRIWSNVGGIEAIEKVTDVGNVFCPYQAGEAEKNACGEEFHGDGYMCIYVYVYVYVRVFFVKKMSGFLIVYNSKK